MTARTGFLLAFCLVASLLSGTGVAQSGDPVRIGWTPWADGVFVTRLAARVIEQHLDHEVELIEMPISEQYQAIAAGRLDAMLMSWQPATHGPYVRRIANRVEHLGVLYDGARLGWAVPDYIPRDAVRSIADLAAHAERFGGRIAGIDPEAGLSRLSRRALERYDLADFELATSSGPEMAATLRQALEEEEWIVVTAWNPHWIFAAHDLRYLDDPEGVLGGAERIHVLARDGFYAEHGDVARLLNRMYLDLEQLEQALLAVEEHGYPEAVNRYIEAHPRQTRYWADGRHEP